MKKNIVLLSSWLLLLAACGNNEEQVSEPEVTPGTVLQQDWAADALWDDGLAEVARYEAERVVYGKPRQFEYTFILVKEEFNKEYNVKTDNYDRSDLFPVMKVNKFARIPTEKYPYHYLSSLFYKREDPATLHKMTISSQEWCGNTFKSFEHTDSSYQYSYNSYWDGQGNGHTALKDGIWFEDGLSYSLRALDFSEGLNFKRPVLDSQINNKANKPTIYNADFLVSKDTTLSQQAWQVSIKFDDEKSSTYWFAQEYPNLLLKQESSDGCRLLLKSATREAYWE